MVDPQQYEYTKEVSELEQVSFLIKPNQIEEYEVSYRFFCEESSEEILLKHTIKCFKKVDIYVFEHYFCPILRLSHRNLNITETMDFIFNNFGEYVEIRTRDFESQIFIQLRKMK
ncbi:hypothetical protein LKM00_26420 [Bacillus wiedmannii]|uniref:hypothetical protein n=1 Tax=Bacillus wiedmannii TaxID=1890302 RepID=UPI001E3DFF81|nr:hypothetical protein [Bacillus wiedmannii]MCC2380935.1 hypothetical protein [Bacillus wiedmannii]MCC2425349.1 hypothetical protein [Bacillus wiedmannii]